jgi:hypothetical protein
MAFGCEGSGSVASGSGPIPKNNPVGVSMLFEIDRASAEWLGDTPAPTDGAYRKKIRESGDEVWVIEINSLAELTALWEREGYLIVGGAGLDGYPTITIYDSVE